MLVRDYMTSAPKTLNPKDTIKDAARLFHKYKIKGAPVVDERGMLCGLITASQLIRVIINENPVAQPVSAFMITNVITVTPETPLEEAYQIPVGHLPVVDADNRLAGMLTKRDLLNAFYHSFQRAANQGEAFIRSAHNGIVIINAFGIITTFNEAAARLAGVPAAAALGKPITEVIPDSGLPRVLATGKSETGCHLTINGRTVFSNRSPICEGSKVVGALAIIQDTSELEAVARELVDAHNHVEALESIFEGSRQGLVVVDRQGVVSKVNSAYEDIFGVRREDIIGRPVVEVIENTRLHIVANTGIPELAQIQNYKGRQIIVNRIPIFRRGQVVGAIGEAVFKDINEANDLLKRLQTLESQLSQCQQQLDGPPAAPSSLPAQVTFDSIIGTSRVIVAAKNLALKAAQTSCNVLILGESGTGKELFARAIHNASDRRAMPFLPINCAAIPAELLEAELFGYEEGAFTGARKGGKKGKFELADKGTLFLDEIGDMPPSMQAKILRVLQDKTLEHVGGTKSFSADVRIIAATNKPLPRLVKEGSFREDLYYRLNVISIQIPPLRERKEDFGLLVQSLMPKICRQLGVPPKQFAPETMALLREYRWPGNVRELINLLEQVAATVDNPVVMPRHLPPLRLAGQAEGEHPPDSAAIPDPAAERERIISVLKHAGGNKVLAARLLGWHRSTLYDKLKKYRIETANVGADK